MPIRIINADVLAGLAQLPSDSVHTVVTSPPYFGLRDYGTGEWDGGDADCEHVAGMARGDTERETPGGRGGSFQGGRVQFRDECGHCGARRVDAQIGLEPTLAEHIARLVEVFEEVRRLLRPDGVCFVNYGDSYNNFRSQMGPGQAVHGRNKLNGKPEPGSKRRGDGVLKEKDLCLIPERLSVALQDAGWWVRSRIIWAKPNPMPESATDRPTITQLEQAERAA